MRRVSNQAELLDAVASEEPQIQAVSDFTVSSQITVHYPLTLGGLSGESPASLYKDPSFPSFMFQVAEGGCLTLKNIVLDGQKNQHSLKDPGNRSLILISGGILHLKNRAVLQNNFSFTEGGGVCFSGNSSYPNQLIMDGNAQICGCSCRTCGGAVMAAAGHPEDKFCILDRALITGNTAAHGAGIYLRSFEKQAAGTLTVSDSASIENNAALGFGGGINFSGFREGQGASSSLTISGKAGISKNTAAYGGGIFFHGANEEDQLDIQDGAVICDNSAGENGGGLCLASRTGASVTLTQSSVSKNKAGGQGGGLFFSNSSADAPVRLALMNTEIRGNQASSCGGGIAFLAGICEFFFHLTDSMISENSSGGQGAGVFLKSSGSGTLNVSQTAFFRNIAEKSGGGLALLFNSAAQTGSLSLSSALFQHNQAESGGGIFLNSEEGSLDTNLYDCSIEDNTALFGSGGGILALGSHNAVSLRGTARLAQNLAGKEGRGIYIGSGSSLILEGAQNIYDSLFLKDQSSQLYLQTALHPNACIRLEASEYITPDKEKAPITVCASASEYFGLQPPDADKFRSPSDGFHGWEFSLNPDRTLILLAPAHYKIRYENLMGADNPNPASYTADSPDLILNPPEPLPDVMFLGWYDDPFSGEQVNIIPHGSTKHYILYARWKPYPSESDRDTLSAKRFPFSLLKQHF
ncbi:hypothetical protein [Anaerostipes sp.]|uniref:hypothetical protein n=1 Tax=Anaerostipes sp. TaxID=1872530 RepID=UPI0025B9FE5A|nr:hypothetical protein [Anaerostipes sp.]MBS7008756.1 hypothetical protein [Anaerostipes sp.]